MQKGNIPQVFICITFIKETGAPRAKIALSSLNFIAHFMLAKHKKKTYLLSERPMGAHSYSSFLEGPALLWQIVVKVVQLQVSVLTEQRGAQNYVSCPDFRYII